MNFIWMKTQSASHQCRRRGDGRNDLARDLPGPVHVGFWDLVHSCSKIGRGRDKFHVVVEVFVEIHHLQSVIISTIFRMGYSGGKLLSV